MTHKTTLADEGRRMMDSDALRQHRSWLGEDDPGVCPGYELVNSNPALMAEQVTPESPMSDTPPETGDDVLRAAIALAAGDREKAMLWYATEELQAFGGKTAAEMVKVGRNSDVLRLLESYEAGFLG